MEHLVHQDPKPKLKIVLLEPGTKLYRQYSTPYNNCMVVRQ